ncbi:N-acetylneuraminate synthase [Pelosinus fermentans]|uniref:N-acetylneuraminate synthase n=1 Tax=Pelosinus fermentans TaxID=365349 RepID=UPI0002685C24|nr:N-acetylneuraminate synthase [Pelosinus fermentans]OAM92778.1 N-acetylneuraminate synthase [Pelosinus fermentans DSM 17108]SDQ56546.1 N-acetylneuraminate synthase [Pelosinus fermentans]
MQQNRVYIIAEAGVNHNGSLEIAKQLIEVAAGAGVDAVKFQTFKAENLVSKDAPKAAYQQKMTNNQETQYEMLKKLELSEAFHDTLVKYCQQFGVQFLSTPFDEDSLNLLVKKFNLPYIKIPSGEITNAPFLLKISKTGKSVILSTGMCTLGEVENSLKIMAFGYTNDNSNFPSLLDFEQAYVSEQGQKALREKVLLLHCTTEYPAPLSEVNLRTMDTLRHAFNLPVGYSDHTEGVAVPIAAVARGAVIIEKHFTLNRDLPGPDHKASLEPEELKSMVHAIRQIEVALGNSVKLPTVSEVKNKQIARKSIVAMKEIKKGQVFTEDNIGVKRPGDGISPMYYWELLGKVADRDYSIEEKIVP